MSRSWTINEYKEVINFICNALNRALLTMGFPRGVPLGRRFGGGASKIGVIE